MNRMKWLISPVLALAAVVLFFISHNSPSFATWYAINFYPIMKNTMGRFFGLFPVSMFEVGLFSIIGVVLWRIGATVSKLCTHSGRQVLKNDWRRRAKGAALVLSYAVSVFLMVFMLTAGINYNRESFAEHVGFEVRYASVDELVDLYKMLVSRAEVIVEEISTCEDGLFVLDREGLDRRTGDAMRHLNYLYGGLGDFFPRSKSPFTSRLIMSNFRIPGFYSPWTMEANFNRDIPGHTIPFIILHEQAHFAGHMREDEANFIAYLAGWHSDDADLMYSSVYRGLMYALSALHRVVSHERYVELFDLLPGQIRRDLEARRIYWQQFDGRMAEINNRVNDAYLRANRQEDGIMSYGRMVDLMLAYYAHALHSS